MSLDLFPIYKSYTQRCRRKPYDIIDLEIKESMKYLVKEDRDRSAMLDIVQRISDLESMQDYKRKYAPEITQAIIDNSYKIKVPFPILHKWNEKKDDEGWFYLGVSDSKKGQVKFGATTLPIWKREYFYHRRWGYPMSVAWKKWIKMPFNFEDQLKKVYQSKLVAGLTSGDSNEWYFGSVGEIANAVEQILDSGKKGR